MDKEQTLQMISAISNAYGASGFEDEAAEAMLPYAEALGEANIDSIRNLFIRRRGNTGGRPVVMLDAHSDEVGFMVQAIRPDGTLNVVPLGGWVAHNVPAHLMRVRNRWGEYIPGITVSTPPHFLSAQQKNAPLDISSITVDVGATSLQDAIDTFGIRIGEPIVPDVEFAYYEKTDLMIGKAFDCRLGCAALLKALQYLDGQSLDVDVVSSCSVQEEVGTRGAAVAANVIKPDIAILFEGCPADDTSAQPHMVQAAIKRGPMLRHIDARMITNPRWQRYALDTAEELGIPVQESVRAAGGTNGAAIHISGKGVPVIVIGIPVRYSHTHYGISAYSDFENSARLAAQLILRLNSDIIASF